MPIDPPRCEHPDAAPRRKAARKAANLIDRHCLDDPLGPVPEGPLRRELTALRDELRRRARGDA